MLLSVITLSLALTIFFLSKILINNLYIFFRRLFKNDKFAQTLIILFVFPGTVVHESSHFITAILLMLPVKKMNLFSIVEDDQIKLGSVIYEKKDSVRGFLVGIAPFFGGLTIIYIIFSNLMFSNNILLNILWIYIISAITLTMFSSNRDLQDITIAIPLIVLTGYLIYAFLYIFQVNISNFINDFWLEKYLMTIKELNKYLVLSILIQVTVILGLRLLKRFTK